MVRQVALAAALFAALLAGGSLLAAGGASGGGLHAGQIVAIVIGITMAVVLLVLSAGYILPKPPKF